MRKVPINNLLKYIRLKDSLQWNEFGAPDPSFFDKWIKDNLLEVIDREGEYMIVQDPTDPEGIFSVHQSWISEQVPVTKSIAS